jgi:peptidoglycan/LPS O-acetylase OafA/YrhL
MSAMGEGTKPADPAVTPAGDAPRSVAASGPTSGSGTGPAASSGLTSERPQERSPVKFTLGNRPALTGIRAIGVSLVLIYHSNFQTLPGSWVALGIFFVLSGFLITSMLAIEQQRTGGISLRSFYSRRSVRLLPPLVITIVLIALYAIPVAVFDAANRIWADSAAALFYVADYRSALGSEPTGGFLAQCWSLAVEEQFYLIWAALLFVALRYGSRRAAYAIAIGGIVLCAADRMIIVLQAHTWTLAMANRTYFAFDTRADALFLGCLLGLLATGGHLEGWSARAKSLLTAATIASGCVLFFIVCTIDLGVRSLPLFWLPISEIASAVVIVYLVVLPVSLTAKILSVPTLVLVGNMSYAMYLFHWPVYVAISPYTVHWGYWPMEAVRLAIIVGLAVASWYLVEQPLLIWRRRTLDPLHPKPAGSPTRPAGVDLPAAATPVAPVTPVEAAPGDVAPVLE